MREKTPSVTRGTIRVRHHCTMRWWRADRWWTDEEAKKIVVIEPHHCAACITAVEKLRFGELEGAALH